MSFASLKFDNRFVAALPADPESENFRRQVSGACYSRVLPAKVAAPHCIAYSDSAAQLLGLNRIDCESELFTQVLAGNAVLAGMDPHATCYGGHQFGNWAGQLGDGRAINLGEVVTAAGEHWMLQLKGAGPTPYSRGADGLAVLRSSIREFLCSEAMHGLGVPTTRALALLGTGESVVRDMFYDGRPAAEPGAVVCRLAPSFTRFGHFEILAARDDLALLRRLVDVTIKHDFPQLGDPHGHDPVPIYLAWFAEICRRTALMVAHWMRVGFVHGVMNTDNMSVLGLTIDYGPYGWLDNYDPDWTPNTTDAAQRRYRFGQQPHVAQWNLWQLGNALLPLVGEAAPLEELLKGFMPTYRELSQRMMAEKLGLAAFNPDSDIALFAELDAVLQLAETDMTIFFRRLAQLVPSADEAAMLAPLIGAYYDPQQLTPTVRARTVAWLRDYCARVRADGRDAGTRRRQMDRVNPKYVLRNYLAQLAIDRAEQGDYAMIHELLVLLREPYVEQPAHEAHAQRRPDWARHRAGCSMLSCSS